MRMPLISIIMPTFMHAGFIAQAIISVMGQTYQNWELIIVDDGSSDNTKEVVASFLADRRIMYFAQVNAGASAARNKGIMVSGGELIAYLDSDDVFLPDHLQVRVEMINNLGVDFVFGPLFVVNGAKKEIYHGELSDNETGCVMPLMVMHKRICFDAGLFNPADVFEEDLNLFLKMRKDYYMHQFKSPVTAVYNIHAHGIHLIYERAGESGVRDYQNKNKKE